MEKKTKQKLQEAKQKLQWQYRAGIINETLYAKKLGLIEAEHINANKGVLREDAQKIAKDLTQAYKSGPEATVNYLNQNTGDTDLKKVLQAPKEDGKEDDDNAEVGSVSGQAMSFAPTQSEIDLMKSVSWPLGSARNLIDAINTGPVAAGIVADGEAKIIIDGHHRWSGAIAIGGDKAQIEGTDFKLPGDNVAQKLAAAQILIVAKNQGGKVPAQGEAFKTNILGVGASGIEKMIIANVNKQTDKNAPGALLNDKMIKDLVAQEISGADAVYKWLGINPFPKETKNKGYKLRLAIAKKVAENLAKLPQPAQGSPERKFMPQFDPKATPAGPKVGDVKDDAASGTFNIAPPFIKESALRKAIRSVVISELKKESVNKHKI